MSSPLKSRGRYCCFCASLPKSTSGTIVRLACAPKVAPNDAERASLSETTSEVTLSSPSPPYASGTSTPSRPRSAPFLTRSRASVQSFSSRRSRTGSTSLSTNSCAVRAISRCSSVSCSGVKTLSASGAWRRNSPPRRTVVVSVVVAIGRSHPFKDTSSAHPATNAHGHHAVARLASFHLVQDRRRQLRAGAAERMAERDRAAVDVEPIGIDRQRAQAGEDLRGEGFVQLDEIDLVEGQAGELQRFLDRRNGSDAEALRLDAGGREGDEARHRREAGSPRASGGGDDHRRGAVARLRRVPCGHRPLRVEGWPELREGGRRGVAPRPLVDGEADFFHSGPGIAFRLSTR